MTVRQGRGRVSIQHRARPLTSRQMEYVDQLPAGKGQGAECGAEEEADWVEYERRGASGVLGPGSGVMPLRPGFVFFAGFVR